MNIFVSAFVLGAKFLEVSLANFPLPTTNSVGQPRQLVRDFSQLSAFVSVLFTHFRTLCVSFSRARRTVGQSEGPRLKAFQLHWIPIGHRVKLRCIMLFILSKILKHIYDHPPRLVLSHCAAFFVKKKTRHPTHIRIRSIRNSTNQKKKKNETHLDQTVLPRMLTDAFAVRPAANRCVWKFSVLVVPFSFRPGP